MAPLKRRDTSTLTTSDQEIPIATSDSMGYLPVRRSSRVSRSPIAVSSSSRGRQPSVQAMRSPRVPTTIQTTPPRPPPRSRKGKGHRRTESVSEDPNMSLFRNPSYVAPELGAIRASSSLPLPSLTLSGVSTYRNTVRLSRGAASSAFPPLTKSSPNASCLKAPAASPSVTFPGWAILSWAPATGSHPCSSSTRGAMGRRRR